MELRNAHTVQVRLHREKQKNLCRWSLHYISCNLRFEASDGKEKSFSFLMFVWWYSKKILISLFMIVYDFWNLYAVQTFDVPLPLSFTSWVHPHTRRWASNIYGFVYVCLHEDGLNSNGMHTHREREMKKKTSDRISGRRNLLVLGLTTFNLKTKMPYYPFADCVSLSLSPSGSAEIDTFISIHVWWYAHKSNWWCYLRCFTSGFFPAPN